MAWQEPGGTDPGGLPGEPEAPTPETGVTPPAQAAETPASSAAGDSEVQGSSATWSWAQPGPPAPASPGAGAAPSGPTAPPPPPGYGTPPPPYGGPPPGYQATPPPGVPGAPVAWAPPSAAYAPTGLEVPGAPGLRFAGVAHRFLAYWLDLILVGIVAGILSSVAIAAAGRGTTETLIFVVITLGAEFLYFVGMWTSAGRATLGMRLMKLQIGNAADGRTLSVTQAVIRWAALGLPFQALYTVPGLEGVGALASLWSLALLVSTALSSTRQGIHDRIAGSAIVQPIGASTPAMACLVALLLLVVVPLLMIIALVLLGVQVSTILSDIGNSV